MDEQGRAVERTPAGRLSKEQKAGLSFVIFCGFGALILGSMYLWRHMALPFAVEYSGPRLSLGEEKQDAEKERLQKTDTDHDGVTDYDEIYVFKSSPYLADSDSDGLNDQIEITSGGDPNCAEGDDCLAARDEDIVTSTTSVVDLGTTEAELQAQAAQIEAALAQMQTLPPAEIRKLLIESGGNANEVNALSDEEVTAFYLQLLESLNQDGALEAAVQASVNSNAP